MENRTSDKNITNSRMDNIDVPVYQTDVENTHFEEYRLVYFDGKPPVNDNKYQYQSFGENKVVTETTSSEREQSLQRQRMIEDTMERVLSGTSSVIGSTCVMLIAILLVVNVFRPLAKKISKDFDVPMSIVHTSESCHISGPSFVYTGSDIHSKFNTVNTIKNHEVINNSVNSHLVTTKTTTVAEGENIYSNEDTINTINSYKKRIGVLTNKDSLKLEANSINEADKSFNTLEVETQQSLSDCTIAKCVNTFQILMNDYASNIYIH